jgi:hypothetical protein
MRVQEPGRDRPAPERSNRHAAPVPSERRTGPARPPLPLLALQRAIGNRAVTAMLAEQRTHADPAPADPPAARPVQRATAHTVLRSAGRPLQAPLRAEMEARLGADFSGVRLHTGAAAERSARELGARAYTSGEHVVLGTTGADKHTLAHELTHVIQQRQGPVAGTDGGDGLRVSDPSDRFERAAEANATRVMSAPHPAACREDGPTDSAERSGPPAVQRAVGFEFEAQWNVRKMEPDSEAVRAQRSQDRQRLIDARILGSFLTPASPYHRRLDLAEREQLAGAGGPALRAQWFGGDGLLTPAGEHRLAQLQVTADERERLLSSLLARGEVAEEPLAGENLGKGRVDGLVVAGTDFDLTADASPTGGSNLEWITDPLTSVAQVGRVMDDVTAMAGYLDGRRGDRFIPSEDVRAGGGRPVPDLRIYPDGNPLSFAPQATLGARLERLPKLVDYLANRKKMSLVEHIPVLNAKPVKSRRQASNDLSAGGLGALPAARAGADTAVRALLPGLGFTVPRNDAKTLTGLVMHLAAYLLQGEALQPGANAKSVAGALMSRTDFAHGFSLLSTALKTHFQANPDAFAALVLRAANMDNRGGERLFGNTVERGLANDRTETTITLTRSDWLRALPSGTDLLKNWEHLAPTERALVDEDSARAVHKSLGALGTQQNLVGPNNDYEAVVAELRRMKDAVPTARLKQLAISVYTLVEQLNSEQKLRY